MVPYNFYEVYNLKVIAKIRKKSLITYDYSTIYYIACK